MNNEFAQACLAMVLGIGSGMLLSVAGQKMLNQHTIKTCSSKPGHQLVMISGFVGDAFYCMDKRYI